MPIVRSVRVHSNPYGSKYHKEVGDEYSIPDPVEVQNHVASGLVEYVSEDPEPPKPIDYEAEAKKAQGKPKAKAEAEEGPQVLDEEPPKKAQTGKKGHVNG
jgi:hypothetical protein